MAAYIVKWEIDIEAPSPEAAAYAAYRTQQTPDHQATHFEVTRTFGTPDAPVVSVDLRLLDPLELATLKAQHGDIG